MCMHAYERASEREGAFRTLLFFFFLFPSFFFALFLASSSTESVTPAAIAARPSSSPPSARTDGRMDGPSSSVKNAASRRCRGERRFQRCLYTSWTKRFTIDLRAPLPIGQPRASHRSFSMNFFSSRAKTTRLRAATSKFFPRKTISFERTQTFA